MSQTLVPGSLGAIATGAGQTLAEAFINADAIVVVDVSGSMGANDARGGQSRYTVACTELARLQQRMPGKVAVVAFSGAVEFCPSGVPLYMGGSTDLAKALRFVRPADGTVRFVVVSDGQPNDPDKALEVARRFSSAIDVIYVGPPDGGGELFLAELARASGGTYVVAERAHELAATVQAMLTGGTA